MSAWRPSAISWRAVGLALVVIALAIPVNLGFNQMPAPGQWNQLGGLLAWGLFIAVLGGAWPRGAPIKGLTLAITLMASGVVASSSFFGLPGQMAAPALAMLLAALTLMASGAACARSARREWGFALFCSAWLFAGVVAALVAIIQLFFPELTSDPWIVPTNQPGRAIGNLRQPNHLAAVLLWSIAALLGLASMRKTSAGVVVGAAAMLVLLVTGIVSSSSRTGLLGILILAGWGLLDRRLAFAVRPLAIALPMIYGVAWAGVSAWSDAAGLVFAGDLRLQAADLSSSRFALWSNSLELIRQQPWSGVGFGNFNLAWMLTPMPGRPQHLFDQSHSLPLQLLVEFGVVLGTLILGLLLASLYRLGRRWAAASSAARAATVMILIVGAHSLLEYPLWYSYFLLPTAWALGFALSEQSRPAAAAAAEPTQFNWVFPVAGLLMVAAGVAAGVDYRRVTPIFAPSATSANWHQRVSEGREALLFSHFADYAAVVSRFQPDRRAASFEKPVHYLLDAYLLEAWTLVLGVDGRLDEARHLAARMREFDEVAKGRFFAACRWRQSALPVQCVAPAREVPWTEYLSR